MAELHIIASGLSAQLVLDKITEFAFNSTLSGTQMVSVLATLPDCSRSGSDWLVELIATGRGVSEVLARNGSPARLAGLSAPVAQSVEMTPVMAMDSVMVPPAIKMTSSPALGETMLNTETGTMLQLSSEYPLNTRRYTGLALKVSYWPDKGNADDVLQLSTSMGSQ